MWSTPIHVEENGNPDPGTRFKEYLQIYFQEDLDQLDHAIRNWETSPQSGYWLATHNHGHAHFTSIYYEHVSGEGGELILHDPRGNANRGYPSQLASHFEPYIIKPTTGMTVTFPAYVYHTASPFYGIIRIAKVSDLQLYITGEGKTRLGTTAI